MLDLNEWVECDGVYIGLDPEYVKCKYGVGHSISGCQVRNTVRARHETVNKRFKQWQVLDTPFRHQIKKHMPVFNDVACITQVAIEQGEILFDVDNYDDEKFKIEDKNIKI